MKAVKFLPYVLFIGLLIALAGSVGLGLAQEPEPPEAEVQPQGEVSIAATVGSKFSYQGVLKEGGSPVTGSRNMTFRLYSDGTCSTQVGSDIVESGVPVADGLFSVELVVTQSDFNGQGLWLEVEVGGTKIGCQEILPVPYALSLRPGAYVRGEQTNGHAIYAYNTATTGSSTYGVWGRTASSDTGASGVFGQSSRGTTYGVFGRAGGNGLSASGVAGEATGTFGQVYGVWGRSASPAGAAIYGSGDVKQGRADNGLVKAAVFMSCSGPPAFNCNPTRSFNNVTANSISGVCGGFTGRCSIDFGFDINDRFWVATGADYDEFANCWLGSSNDELECYRWDASAASSADGPLMVLVY